MSIASGFYDWQHPTVSSTRSYCSPNLTLLLEALTDRWGGSFLGCYGVRPIRGSNTVTSTHAYGAALDWGYPARLGAVVKDTVCPWLVAWSAELGIQAIHDYPRSRIWRAGRTELESDACDGWWKAQRASQATGMGQSWATHLHVEVPPWTWDDQRPLADRGID